MNENSHNFILNNRNKASFDGILGVISFDEHSVVLKTALGELTIDGEALNITKLELEEGKLFLEGNVCGMFYSDINAKQAGKRRSLWGS